MPCTLAPVLAVAPVKQLPFLMRKLRELRKFTFCVRRQRNADGCERLVVAGLQVREPAEGIDDLGLDLVGVVGRLTERLLGRPRIEEAAIDAVRVVGKTAR